MWVQFPPLAPIYFVLLAQLVEHVLGKDEVIGSSPIRNSTLSYIGRGVGTPKRLVPVSK